MCLAHDQLMLCSCYELSCQETNYINNCTNYVFICQNVFVPNFKSLRFLYFVTSIFKYLSFLFSKS